MSSRRIAPFDRVSAPPPPQMCPLFRLEKQRAFAHQQMLKAWKTGTIAEMNYYARLGTLLETRRKPMPTNQLLRFASRFENLNK